jgi:hypothetical protein
MIYAGYPYLGRGGDPALHRRFFPRAFPTPLPRSVGRAGRLFRSPLLLYYENSGIRLFSSFRLPRGGMSN